MNEDVSESQFRNFQRNYEHHLRIYNEAANELAKAKKLRDDNCPHLNVVKKCNNISGTYYDHGYSEHWSECTLCRAKSEVITRSDGHYG